MKAMVLREFNRPLREEEVPVPQMGEEDVLIRVKACGVCYTDVKITSGLLDDVSLPRIPGHEVSGEVAAKGKTVSHLKEGDRVCVYFYLNCGQCEKCLESRENLCSNLRGRVGFYSDGGYAEFVKVPASHAFKIPQGLPFEEAAILADAVATPLHALREQAKVKAGETVVVLGAGGLGIHAIQIGKLLECRVLAVDLDKKKLDLAKEWGAEVFEGGGKGLVESILLATGKKGVDVVLDLVGKNETFQDSLSVLKRGGRYVLVGYSFERPFSFFPRIVMGNEFALIGSRASCQSELREVIQWAGEGKIKPLVSQIVPLTQANRVLERLKNNEVLQRVVLQP